MTGERKGKWKSCIARIVKTSVRDAALVAMIVHYGFKPNEVLGLRREDVDWRAGTITVRKRRLPLRQNLKLLKGLQAGESTWVFEGRKKRSMSSRQLQLITKRWVGKSPGELRREFARDFVANGGSLLSLKEKLGHTHISSTARLLE